MRKPTAPEPDRLQFPQFPVRKPDQAEADRAPIPPLAGRQADALEPNSLIHSQYVGRPETAVKEPIAGSEDQSARVLDRGGVLLVAVLSYFPILWLSNNFVRRSGAASPGDRQEGDSDLAIRHLEHYLQDWPDDLAALEEAARLMTENARTYDQISKAADLNYRVVRLDPYGKDRQDTRCRAGRALGPPERRPGEPTRSSKDSASPMAIESRYQAAQSIARELAYGVKLGDKVMIPGVNTSESHRLLGRPSTPWSFPAMKSIRSITPRRSANSRRRSGSTRATRSRPSGWSSIFWSRSRTRPRPSCSWTTW